MTTKRSNTAGAAAVDPERQLMIKTKACQRLVKEVKYYIQEAKDNEIKLSQMKSNVGTTGQPQQYDPYDIKKFEEVLGESYMMIPDSQRRLDKALEELHQYLVKDDDEQQQLNKKGEWYMAAQQLLAEHYHHPTSSDDGAAAITAIDDKKKQENEQQQQQQQQHYAIEETNVDDVQEGEVF